MSDTLRIKGQETQVRIIQSGRILSTITAIESWTWTPEFDLIMSEFIGETSPRFDEIFKGSSFEVTFQPEDSAFLLLLQVLRDRAQRRTTQAGNRIDARFSFTFEGGKTPYVVLPDLKFSSAPVTAGGRDQFVNVKLSGKCSSFVPGGL